MKNLFIGVFLILLSAVNGVIYLTQEAKYPEINAIAFIIFLIVGVAALTVFFFERIGKPKEKE